MYGEHEDYAQETITDDVIQPFQLESSGLRGRIVRLGSVLDDILDPHGYPATVTQLLGETATLCALLSSMLKFDGIFTLQTSGDGPIPMLLADMTSAGDLRACARFHDDRVEQLSEQIGAFSEERIDGGSDNQLAQLLGKGYIAFTVDPAEEGERYQGIVELKGASLVDCVQHYFTQSEQIKTGITISVGLRDGKWRSEGIMIQRMPEEGGVKVRSSNTEEDDWRRAMILMQSCTKEEMLSLHLTPHAILTRLFHEEGVRVFDPVAVKKGCRCSEQKVENILMMMSPEDREEMTVDEKITMTCEFCSSDFVFDPAHIDRKIKEVRANNLTK